MLVTCNDFHVRSIFFSGRISPQFREVVWASLTICRFQWHLYEKVLKDHVVNFTVTEKKKLPRTFFFLHQTQLYNAQCNECKEPEVIYRRLKWQSGFWTDIQCNCRNDWMNAFKYYNIPKLVSTTYIVRKLHVSKVGGGWERTDKEK